LNGDPRIAYGRSSLTADMGAYEHYRLKVVEVLYFGEGAMLMWTWASRPGKTYVVHSCADILTGDWTEEATVPSRGATTFWSEVPTGEKKKFYRVEMK